MYRVHVYNISVFRKLSLTDYICQDFRDVQLSLYSLNCMWDTKIREAVRLMIKKKKNYQTVGTSPKYNKKIVERCKIDTSNRLIHNS